MVEELLLRHRARSVIIVCPPSLSLKWRDEMREKFGLEFEIVNTELMARVLRTHGPNANPFRLYPRVIVSMAWLPSLRAQRLLRTVYADARDTSSARRYAFDVLIVDEAHHVAPASPAAATGFRGYATDSDRTRATMALAEKCEHRLFLSATPHNGYSESFTAILAAGLTPTVGTDYERWKPLHWIIAVPDVMEKGGFDAIIDAAVRYRLGSRTSRKTSLSWNSSGRTAAVQAPGTRHAVGPARHAPKHAGA